LYLRRDFVYFASRELDRKIGRGGCTIYYPGLGRLGEPLSLVEKTSGGSGLFHVGQEGVRTILASQDGRADFIVYDDKTLAYVYSQFGHSAIYPVREADLKKPVKAVLMDLDGTSVKSEHFWVWIIEQTTARLLQDPNFRLEESDLPHVMGHSVVEHLKYCISKYCPQKTVTEARSIYFSITKQELKAIENGDGKMDAFQPAVGLKEFLLELKLRKIKIGLVTSGLREKAWPEIKAVFAVMQLGDPLEFYDAIITAGSALRKGQTGTLGELEAKPHPWLYAETAAVGLGIPWDEYDSVVGIEDSGAGVLSIRLAGFPTIGVAGGNIEASGTRSLLHAYCQDLKQVGQIIFD